MAGRIVRRLQLIFIPKNRVATLIVMVQSLIACFTFYIGANDVASALTFGSRFRGGIFLIMSLTILAGAVAVVVTNATGSRGWGELALVGSIVSAVVGISLIILQWQGGDYRNRVIVWILMTLASGWCVFRVLKALLRAKVPLSVPKGLLTTLSVATVLSLSNFLYANAYQPSTAAHFLSLDIEYGKPLQNKDGNQVALPITLKVRNPTSVRVYVIGSSLSITRRMSDLDRAGLSTQQLARANLLNGQPLAPFVKVKGYDLVYAEDFLLTGSFYDPSQEKTITRIAEFPLGNSYDSLRIEASIMVARGDRFKPELKSKEVSWYQGGEHKDAPKWVAEPGVEYVWSRFKLEEGNTVRRLTRAPQLVNVWWVLPKPTLARAGGPYLQAVVAPEGKEAEEPDPHLGWKLLDRYGLAIIPVITERSSWDLIKSKRPDSGKKSPPKPKSLPTSK